LALFRQKHQLFGAARSLITRLLAVTVANTTAKEATILLQKGLAFGPETSATDSC
jgi:hypothetical protein